MQRPKPLRKGSRVAVTAPCSSEKRQRVDRAEKVMRDIGLVPVMYTSCYEKLDYLSGSDRQRADDVNRAFADDEIEGIVALRGGYGSMRILNMLDYDMIKAHPKVFVGYSDVTALHLALNQKCGLVTFHGPMASSWEDGEDDFSTADLKRHIFGDFSPGEIKNPCGENMECVVAGRATGRITGGNLCMLAATLGTPYEVDTAGKILFIEDVGEELYRIDRMMNSLALAGKFKDAGAIVLGTFRDCSDGGDDIDVMSIKKIADDIIAPFGKPVIANLRVGHIDPQVTIPIGVRASLDAEQRRITILESGCLAHGPG